MVAGAGPFPFNDIINVQFCSDQAGTINTEDYCPKRKWFLVMVYQEKVAPPGPLPVLASEPSDVLLSQRTIDSLEQENAWLKERLAHIVRSQIAK